MYSNGKFYVVHGVWAVQRAVEMNSLEELLSEIATNNRGSFISNFGKQFVLHLLRQRASHDTRIFFNLHGKHYALHLSEEGEVVTEEVTDRWHELEDIYTSTKVWPTASQSKWAVKNNLAKYEEKKQRVYNSQNDRGIAMMDYRQVKMKRSKWFKAAEEEVTNVRNNEDLAITTADLGNKYTSFYNDIEFVQALVKLADKTIK